MGVGPRQGADPFQVVRRGEYRSVAVCEPKRRPCSLRVQPEFPTRASLSPGDPAWVSVKPTASTCRRTPGFCSCVAAAAFVVLGNTSPPHIPTTLMPTVPHWLLFREMLIPRDLSVLIEELRPKCLEKGAVMASRGQSHHGVPLRAGSTGRPPQ